MVNQRFSTRTAQSLLLAVAMLMGIVMLSPPAQAQVSESCVDGVLVGTQCVIEGAPPVAGPSICPVSATVMEDGSECFTLVPTTTVCPAGSIDAGGECRMPVADLPGPPTCEPSFGLLGGQCVRFEDPVAASCLEGTLIGSSCLIVGEAPVNGPATCPVSATVIQDGNECYTLIARPVTPGSCTAPYIAFGSTCKTNNTGTNEVEVFAFTCPAGPAGAFIIENLHTVAGVTKIESCEYSPASELGACPIGTTPDPNGVDCRRPVDLRPGAPMCAVGFGIVDGQCIRYESPTGPSCENGTLQGDLCLIVGPAPVAGPSTCPPGALGVPGGCYKLVTPIQECPAGTTPDSNEIDCRQPVDRVPGGLTCELGFALVGVSCLRYEAPVSLCAGQVVTINMVTGASGQGTSGDDVILGTSGADTINGRGGNDVICAQGGDDTVRGGSGDDTIYGQGGADRLRGNSGNDDVRGGSGDDDVRGGLDNDIVRGNGGNDEVRGGSGDDVVRGGGGNDALRGGSGTDNCIGGNGTDTAARSCEATVSVP